MTTTRPVAAEKRETMAWSDAAFRETERDRRREAKRLSDEFAAITPCDYGDHASVDLDTCTCTRCGAAV